MDSAIAVGQKLFCFTNCSEVSINVSWLVCSYSYKAVLYYREVDRALNILGVGDTPCDPGKWDKQQVAIWMESHSVSNIHACTCVCTHTYQGVELHAILIF